MGGDASVLQWVGLVADVVIVPLFGVLWGMNMRLSRLEGLIKAKLGVSHDD